MQLGEVVAVDGSLRLVAPLPPGTRVYVDADWIGERDGPVPALIVDGPDPDVAAAHALATLGAEVRDVVRGRDPASIEVGGDGATARLVRLLTGAPRRGEGAPAVVVDTVGTVVSVSAALRRVGDLGLVVVAAPAREPLTLSLYADVHVRGLELVCIEPGRERVSTAGVKAETLVETLSAVGPGGQPASGAAWFRVGS